MLVETRGLVAAPRQIITADNKQRTALDSTSEATPDESGSTPLQIRKLVPKQGIIPLFTVIYLWVRGSKKRVKFTFMRIAVVVVRQNRPQSI